MTHDDPEKPPESTEQFSAITCDCQQAPCEHNQPRVSCDCQHAPCGHSRPYMLDYLHDEPCWTCGGRGCPDCLDGAQ